MTVGTETLPARVEPKVPVSFGSRGIEINTMDELARFVKVVKDTEFVPKHYQGNADMIAACVLYGKEIGLSALQSLHGVKVINGKPSVDGDTGVGLAFLTGKLDGPPEVEWRGEGEGLSCTVTLRRNGAAIVGEFSVADAKRSRLWGKQGPWTEYPKRMLKYRALGFALRDGFPDVLKGLVTEEEAIDYPPVAPTNAVTDGSFRRVSASEPGARADALAQELKGNAVAVTVPGGNGPLGNINGPKRRGRPPRKEKEETVEVQPDLEQRAVVLADDDKGDAWEPDATEAAAILEAEKAEAE